MTEVLEPQPKKWLSGMWGFSIVMFGQAISFLGTGMTRFIIPIWAWQVTGEATTLSLAAFFSFAPVVLVSPIAGALVDRMNRKLVMMVSDFAAGLSTLVLLILFTSDSLEIWHLYVLGAFAGIFESFQWPAFSAAITTMVPKEQYGRANGMVALAQSLSGILAPSLAAALLALVGFQIVMVLDIAAAIFAISTLALVFVPKPKATAEGKASRGNLLSESLFGFKYILQRKSLFGLQMVFFFINLTATFGFTVMTAMILARTGNDETILGSVQSLGAVGGVAGGLLLSTWGGPKRRILGVLGGMFIASLFGMTLIGLGTGLTIWAAGAVIENLSIPILNGSNQAIWQAKVPPDLQGKVFSVRRLIAQITAPIAMLLAGPLADKVFEPAMMEGGALYEIMSPIIGSGPGSGMSVMFLIAGVSGAVVALVAFLIPWIRNVEDIMPDHDELELAEPEAAAAEAA